MDFSPVTFWTCRTCACPYELVQQLRGQAGARQIDRARVGLAQVFGAWGHCNVTILKQGWAGT